MCAHDAARAALAEGLQIVERPGTGFAHQPHAAQEIPHFAKVLVEQVGRQRQLFEDSAVPVLELGRVRLPVGGTAAEIEAEFRGEYDFGRTDLEYFRAILEGVIYHQPDIDAAFAGALDRGVDELTPVELALLRQAVYELKERLDVPYKVVISEAVALAAGVMTGASLFPPRARRPA